jgi:hypothetical protein
MNRTRSSWRRLAVALGALAAIGLTTAACGASSSHGSSAGRKDAAAPAQPVAPGGAQTGAGGAGAPDTAGQPGKPLPAPTGGVLDDRSIIYTGTITVRVQKVDDAAAQATALATGAGGFVGGDQRSSDNDRSQAQLTLRVPSAKFQTVVDGLGRLGKEETRQLSTEDVTAKAVDLDARVSTAQASVDRVRALMGKAQTIGDVVSLESELSRREADLESLKSQQRKLADLTALSTITVTLLGPQAAVAKQTKPETGFLAGLKGGWKAFTTSLTVLLTVFGALLPWLVALCVPLVVVLWLTRRMRRRPAAAPAE